MADARPHKVTRRHVQRYAAPARQVFPLICPVREKAWDPDWDCELLYSRSGFAEPDCVFRTVDEEGCEEIWYFTEHDPAALKMQIVRVSPPSRAGKIDIALKERGPSACEVEVTYTFVALDPEGERFLAEYTQESFAAFMTAWERALDHYLRTGERVESMEF